MMKKFNIVGITAIILSGIPLCALASQEGELPSLPKIADSDIQKIDSPNIPTIDSKEFLSCQRRAVVYFPDSLKLPEAQKEKVRKTIIAKGHQIMKDDRDASFPMGTIYLTPGKTDVADKATGKMPVLVNDQKFGEVIKRYETEKQITFDQVKEAYLSDEEANAKDLEATVQFAVMYKSFAVTNAAALKKFDEEWQKISEREDFLGVEDDGLPTNEDVGSNLTVNFPITGAEVKKGQLDYVAKLFSITQGHETEIDDMGDMMAMGIAFTFLQTPDLSKQGIVKLAEILPDCSKASQ